MIQNVKDEGERFPWEIVGAVESLAQADCRELLAEVIDHDGNVHHDDISDELGWDDERVQGAVFELSLGGLLAKRNAGDPSDKYDSYYEVTTYGYRVVDHLFQTLGDGGEQMPK